jgi:hypothetical protein
LESFVDAVDCGRQLKPGQLTDLVAVVRQAVFVSDLLHADAALWGSFWQFDVIAPGYTLPALELTLLRATRLDSHWPQSTSPQQFIADLRAAINHPRAGLWTTVLNNTPLAIFAAPAHENSPPVEDPQLITVVWYEMRSKHLVAGYRTAPIDRHFAGLICQQPPGFTLNPATNSLPVWLTESLAQREAEIASSPTAKLDKAILHWRAGITPTGLIPQNDAALT